MRTPEPPPATLDTTGSRAVQGARLRVRMAQLALRWHRAIGVSAAVFVAFLALTGLLLMQSDRLGLPHVQVSNRWLLDWYGIRPPPPPIGIAVGAHWVTQCGTQIYLDRQPLAGISGALLGGINADGLLQIATDRNFVLVSRDGEIVERMGEESGLPTGLTAAGTDAAGRLVLKSDHALMIYDDATGEFAAAPAGSAPVWQVLRAPPDAVTAALSQDWQGSGLPLERVLLDLHAGRLFGRLGVWVVNLASVALVMLAATGIFLWWKRRPRH